MTTPSDLLACQFPDNLREREERFIGARRDAAQRPQDEMRVGVALSGGGIRSATFSLGFFQGLTRAGLLPRVDYLSTVSGGGYFGAFLGAMFARHASAPAVEKIEHVLASSTSRPVQWLRDNGRYLAPNGSGDRLLAAAVVLRNWVSIAIVMGTFVLTLMVGAHALRVAVRGAHFEVIAAWSRLLTTPWLGLYWSPYLYPPVATFIVWGVPVGWAYWLGRFRANASNLGESWLWVATAIIAGGAFAVWLVPSPVRATYRAPAKAVALLAVATMVVSVALTLWAEAKADEAGRNRVYRNVASRLLSACLMVCSLLMLLGIVDTLGQSVYVLASAQHFQHKTIGALLLGLGTFLTGIQKISKLLDGQKRAKRVALPFALLAGTAAVVVAATLLTILSAVSHGVARGWAAPQQSSSTAPAIALSLGADDQLVIKQQAAAGGAPRLPPLQTSQVLVALFALVVVTWLFGRFLGFVNLSSLSNLYAARLSRAYVGASNPKRYKGAGASLTEEIDGDEIPLGSYRPYEAGGPLHLINVTLNETVEGRSQIEYRDRQGLAMAVGPGGISVGVRHHAVWKDPRGADTYLVPVRAVTPSEDTAGFHIWSNTKGDVSPQPLKLSTWSAISGAAVGTGLGARTSVALSVLLGIGNVRLGYWWNSDAHPEVQHGAAPKPTTILLQLFARLLPVQSAFIQELLARFYGPHQKYWFLTDGGHFENTACYELLRRRVPLILLCDDGADPEYGFEDMANLVRKARIDFGADMRFLDRREAGGVWGAISDLRPKKPTRAAGSDSAPAPADLGARLARAHVAVALVEYNDAQAVDAKGRRPRSIILIVKPTVTGDEPLDVLQYAASHDTFPQEPTADQFFDEAQWESYRQLGEHIGYELLNGLDLDALYTRALEAS